MASLALIAAFAVLFAAPSVRGEEMVTPATISESAEAEEPTPFPLFYCKGICGEGEEGDLVNPGLEVSYQWNLRIPVCSGTSCQSATCQYFSDRLRTLDVSEFECRKHQKGLQFTAGCGCSEPLDDDFGMLDDAYVPASKYVLSPAARWSLIGVSVALFLAIWIGLFVAIRCKDGQAQEEDAKGDEDEEEVHETSDGI